VRLRSFACVASSLVLGIAAEARSQTASAPSPAEPAQALPEDADGVPPDASLPMPDDPPAEVLVRTVSGTSRLRESAQPVKVVEAEVAQRHSADVGEVLARTEGVAVQRSGGLGSQSRLSLHGLT
jgi:vitamin B12 transporter